MAEKMHTFRIQAMGELGIFEGDVFNGIALEGSHEAIRSVGRAFLEPVVVIPASSHDKLVEALRQMVVNSEADGKSYRDCHKKAVAALASLDQESGQ